MRGQFRALASYNYRLWVAGSLVSNLGTWMQRIAQDWLVLTQLTVNDAASLGLVMALQFAPQLLLLPWTGLAADRFDRRKLLICTQVSMGLLALCLGLLTVTGLARLWHVYVFATLLGCATAFDSPAKHTFVAELVGDEDLSNAVGLNSTSFNVARLIGPALAGVAIGAIGTGWLFLVNAASFASVIASLCLLRVDALHRGNDSRSLPASLIEGVRYVGSRPDLKTVLLMLFLVGTFCLNFPIYISTMAVSVFHLGAGRYGLLMSIMAIGSIAGALLAAWSARPGMLLLLGCATLLGVGLAAAAVMPNYWFFGAALTIVGISSVTFTTSTSSFMQLATEPAMRGRVVALRLAIGVGGTPIGAPIVGWVAYHYGPRLALVVGAAAGFTAALVALLYIGKSHGFRAGIGDWRAGFRIDDNAH